MRRISNVTEPPGERRVSSELCIAREIEPFSKTSVGRYSVGLAVDAARGRRGVVVHRSHRMLFSAPNDLSQYRLDTFSTKEPETLDWIDSLAEGSVLWDIGANIGLYSIYAAKARNCRVYAFEPSVFNLELLAKNIFLNGLQNRITIVPIALSDSLAVNTFRMSNTELGGHCPHSDTASTSMALPFRKSWNIRPSVCPHRMQ